MRVCVALVVLAVGAGCATDEASEGAAEASTSAGLCFWRNVRWEDRARLFARGTGQALGHAVSGLPEAKAQPPRVSGVLRGVGGQVVFQGEWRGEGLTLLAEVDVTAQPLFVAWEPVRLGPAGMVAAGGALRLLAAEPGRALVTAADAWGFEPAAPHAATVTCEQLSLRRPTPVKGKAPAGRPVTLPAGAALAATDAPGGVFVGTFTAGVARAGWVLEEREGAAHLVVVEERGAVWRGWVDPKALVARAPAAAPVAGVTLTPRPAPAGALRRCGSPLTLRVRVGDEVAPAGTLDVGAAFATLEPFVDARAAEVAIAPEVSWLRLEPGAVLLAPASAARCPEAAALPR